MTVSRFCQTKKIMDFKISIITNYMEVPSIENLIELTFTNIEEPSQQSTYLEKMQNLTDLNVFRTNDNLDNNNRGSCSCHAIKNA